MSDFVTADAQVTVNANAASSHEMLTLSWDNLGYSVSDRQSQAKEQKYLLRNQTGLVHSGQILAVMGPSGSGKSTFLDVLAGRKSNAGTTHGRVLLNGAERPMKKYSSYVTQDDSLIGCFTVRETVRWAVELNLPTLGRKAREQKVQDILAQFGLVKCADSHVGDAIIRGISGGEKRRLSIAIQLVKERRVIFLDEPTSGLDSAASFKVVESIKDLAKRKGCVVICVVHQPSPSTYGLFDKVLFLARGNTVYFGESNGVEANYFESVGHKIPIHVNVPDAVLDYINVDFLGDEALATKNIDGFVNSWKASVNVANITEQVSKVVPKLSDESLIVGSGDYTHNFFKQVEILTRRNFSNAVKNILLFWIRLAMYLAMAILMGTTWLRMSTNQNTVQDRFSAIFFAIAFLAFMSVAGIPAILEERAVFYRERLNRTYSVGAYVLANTIVSVPFIFLISCGFSVVAYWLMGMNSGASNFFVFIAYLFLALYVAESMVILLAAIFPIFVAALTLASFFNGLEMVTQGYFVRRQNIPGFWKYVFHYWNYQKWSWEALIANEFVGLTFQCEPSLSDPASCFCSIPSSLGPNACTFSGEDVIAEYGYGDYSYYKSAVCLLALIVAFRLMFYVTLRIKKPQV